jgi:hypothetical protein
MYLLSISLLGDLVERYVTVLLPFVLVATAIEFSRVSRQLTRNDRIATLSTMIVMGVGIFLMPRIDFDQIPDNSRKLLWPQLAFRQNLEPDARVLSMHPLDAYLIGGTWMILPNDSLEQVVEYGRKTNSLWLFVARYALRDRDETYYVKASWYRDRDLEVHYPDLVQRCQLAETRHYRFDLYRIRPEDSLESADPNECEPVIFQKGEYPIRNYKSFPGSRRRLRSGQVLPGKRRFGAPLAIR